MIIGYPSAIKILGELVEKGEIQIKVFRVISCGEPLNANLRRYMEEVFHADVVNIYGASESLALGVETNHEEGMYLFDDMNFIEVEDGTMYLTSLYNYVQPLIRYKISDQLKLKETDEECIYPFTKAESLLGRNEDLMWFEDRYGNREFLHPLSIEGFCIEGMLDYQFRQIDYNSFEMLIEASGEGNKESIQSDMLKNMTEILCKKNLGYVKFDIQFVEEILPDPQTGKKRLILK
jgi:phenylacetate-CoA ligase